MRGDRVRLVLARDIYLRNSWRPVLAARLAPDGAGCRLVGRIGTTRFAGWFTALWALAAAAITAVTVPLGIGAAVARTASAATVVVVGLVSLALDGGFAALTVVALRSGERDEAAMRDWLRATLDGADRP